jgi:DNA-binding LytR/AlgR family response regulator
LKSIKIYLVEDEPLIAITIETALKKQGFVICGDADNVDDAIQEIEKQHPDLVLVDINLEGIKDGIDLALYLDSKNIPYLYLTSQTDPETIARVKKTAPLGYIVKPFTETSLRSNIEIAWHSYTQSKSNYIMVRSEGSTLKIKQNDILFLKAFDNYCYLITKNDKHLIPHTLKYVSEKLDAENFIKTHRSYIVNLDKISSIQTGHVVIGDQEIPLSVSNKNLVKQKLSL